ncbi:Hypothetical_protein [Hexamita inflata]|uniref:Hypothetical_protein n=1 Tax=Hexamita inflata TaxID=28002 RepID=A0AA86PX39_9EUKA|nr:Hypothetical protein HINF_LOCUS29664 [Hexamita inflata]
MNQSFSHNASFLQSAHRFKSSCKRRKSESNLEFQNKFARALKNTLSKSSPNELSNESYSDLCQITNKYLKTGSATQLWLNVQKLVPEKNERQLRDYYQKSFMRQMYEECISGQDKILLCQLIDQMPGAKPAQIVEKYIQMTGCVKYFKRNLVMYVINRKQK